jgi:hypothetical protein
VHLPVYALAVVVIFSAAAELLFRFSDLRILFVLLFIVLVSPIAYLIRESRRGRPSRGAGRRGAERIPILPPNEDVE